ncbi:MAG: biosynthetic-type acetolactate synthase large subunit [archaeon]
MKGSEMILKTLMDNGISESFGYPGGQVIPLFDAIYNSGGKFKNILVRHEQAAAHAADAYARVKGTPGVAIATSGPGATNLITGLATAHLDSSPLIAFGGQVPIALLGNDAFQESDMMGITLPITKHNYQIRDPNQIGVTILKSIKIATSGRPGPIYIELPKDTQVGVVTKETPKTIHIPTYNPTMNGHPEQIKKAAKLLLDSQRPVIIAGGGVIISNASQDLAELVETTLTPVTTTLMGKGSFPENHPLCLGMLGMHGRKVANHAIIESDLIISLGCRFSDRITGRKDTYTCGAKVIHIDIDPAEIGKNIPVDIPIVGDIRCVLKDLNIVIKKLTKKRKETEWSKKMKELNKLCNCDTDIDSYPINPKKIMFELNKAIKDTDIITTGVGQHQMFAAHYIKRKYPRTFISSGGMGTMGFGLPAAIGAKTAKPSAEVFDLDGDGSFAMNIQELATLKEENIKVIPVIFENNYLGMVRQWLEIFFDRRYSNVNLGKNTDFTKIAQAYNLNGITIERSGDIAPALKQAIKNPESTIITIKIEPESNILPMLPPGGSITEAFGGCITKQGHYFDNI